MTRRRSRSTTTPPTRSSSSSSRTRSSRAWPRPTPRSPTPCCAEAAGYIDVIVTGGEVALPLVGNVDILGLRRSQAIIEAAVRSLPKDAPERVALTQVARFARLAADNLDVSKPILGTIGSPVDVKQTNVSGATTPLSALLRGRGGDRLADVRRPAAGRRAAGARARAARVRPARPRPRLAHGAAVGEDRARGAVRARRLRC